MPIYIHQINRLRSAHMDPLFEAMSWRDCRWPPSTTSDLWATGTRCWGMGIGLRRSRSES